MLVKQRMAFMVVALVLFAPRVFAQAEQGGPDPSKVRVRIGPLWVNPSIALTNLGVDSNVFNTPTNPKSDFTFTASPRAEAWLRIGRTWLNGTVNEDIVWYQKYGSERSDNTRSQLMWSVPLTHLSFRLGTEFTNTHERPGFEIDSRAQRSEYGYNAAVDVTFLSKTSIGISAARQMVNFDKSAHFEGTNLHDALNRTRTTGSVNLSHRLTPLTTLTLSVTREEERFTYDSLRDSNSMTIRGIVKFDPFALLKGTATFGYRDFEPMVAGLPSYKGSTAAVDLAYTAAQSTRFGVRVLRDVQYSFYVNEPYYLQTGVTVDVAQQIYGPVEVVARGTVSRLAYRERTGIAVLTSDRIDRLQGVGGSINYSLSRDLRIGFNVDKMRRTSVVENRDYEGFRYGTSVMYGF